MQRLGWQDQPYAELAELPPLDLPGVADVLGRMPSPLDSIAEKPELVQTLHHLSEGDPLLVSLYGYTARKTLHQLSYIPRDDVVKGLGTLIPVIEALGGKEAITDTVFALMDVHTWWP